MNKIRILLILSYLMLSIIIKAQTTYYIDAASGNDSNNGSQLAPFKTIGKGISTLGSNIGTLLLRSGTHLSASKLSLTKSGQTGNRIKIWAYPTEKVIIDFTGNTSDGFSISGSYYHLKDLDIRKAGHNGINISGNDNIIENCITRNCGNTGLHLTGSAAPGPSNNLILNCDSYYNFDSPIGGNADGFSAKWDVGTGNIFRGCRAFNNSDDGWDLWMCTGSILIDSCYAFRNGIDIWHTGQVNGNGNGFKLGGNNVATPHTVKNCVAFDNAGNGGKGFDENNNLAGQTLFNCTSFRNKNYNFALYNDPLTSGTHTVKNCISYLSGKVDNIKNAVQEKNSWQGFTVTSADFKSIDTTGFVVPRDANGRIPKNNFLRLADGSSFIDAGVQVGTNFTGTAPDLGAFEYGLTTGIGKIENSLQSIDLAQNFPNPFNSSTAIPFKLTKTGNITLKIYNTFSQEVITLINKVMDQGSYIYQFDGQQLDNGIYYYVLNANNFIKTRKMIIAK